MVRKEWDVAAVSFYKTCFIETTKQQAPLSFAFQPAKKLTHSNELCLHLQDTKVRLGLKRLLGYSILMSIDLIKDRAVVRFHCLHGFPLNAPFQGGEAVVGEAVLVQCGPPVVAYSSERLPALLHHLPGQPAVLVGLVDGVGKDQDKEQDTDYVHDGVVVETLDR